MAVRRFTDPGTGVYRFTDRVLVRCPGCAGCALVREHFGHPCSRVTPDRRVEFRRRLYCPGCGLLKDEFVGSSVWGRPCDPYFRLPLWLTIDFGPRRLLWAYNPAHLELIESYISATIRERGRNRSFDDGQSLLEQLPAWVKSGRNRTRLLRRIAVLRRETPQLDVAEPPNPVRPETA